MDTVAGSSKTQSLKETQEKSELRRKEFLENPSIGDRLWNVDFPCYEIINIEFEVEGSSDESDSDTDDAVQDELVDIIGGSLEDITDNDTFNIADIGKNITLDLGEDGSDGSSKDPVAPAEAENEPTDTPGTTETSSTWTCPFCPFSFDDLEPFIQHFKEVHGTNCTKCVPNKSFSTLDDTLDHVTQSHMSRNVCSACVLLFDTAKELKEHADQNHSAKEEEWVTVLPSANPLFCHKYSCKTTFETLDQLMTHLKEIHKSGICGAGKCKSRDETFSHYFVKHLRIPLSCAELDCEFTSLDPFEVKKHFQDKHKRFQTKRCEICRRYISNEAFFKEHMKKHEDDPEKTFICDICGVGFLRSFTLEVHRKRHFAEERKFKCDYCDKAFFTVNLRNTHERLHTGERPFTCDFCDKAFATTAKLNKHHIHHHSDEPARRFICSYCGKDFHSMYGLNTHETRKHNVVHVKAEGSSSSKA